MHIKEIISDICKIITQLWSWIRGSKQKGTDHLQCEYFTTATQYYIAGRYAYFSGLIPTAGNQFHHAVEMYLKGYLSLQTTESERIRLGHSLKRIWRVFKQKVGDTVLTEYDTTIKALDRFESLRYPEKSAIEGCEIHFSLVAPNPPSTGQYAMPSSQRYDIVLHQVDHLIATIFQKSGLNPQFFSNRLNDTALTFLRKENPTTIWVP